MKLVFPIFCLISLFCFDYLHGQCIRGISTNPSNPINNEFSPHYPTLENPWENNFEIVKYDGFGFIDLDLNPNAGWLTGSTNFKINSPYDDNAVPGRPELSAYYDDYGNPIPYSERDHFWEDGWELLWLGTGYFPNGEGIHITNNDRIKPIGTDLEHKRVPYIIMYNRYRGVIRLFANVYAELDNYTSSNMEFGYLYNSGTVSGLLRHADIYDRPLDQITKISTISSVHQNPGNNKDWFSTDIQAGYDPCVCDYLTNLNIVFHGFNTSTLTVYGRSVGVDMDVVDSNNEPNVDLGFLSNVEVKNGLKSGNAIYEKTEYLIDDYKETLERYNQELKAYNSAKNSLLYDALVATKSVITADIPNLLSSHAVTTFISNEIGCVTGACPTNLDDIESKLKKGSKFALTQGYNFLSAQLKPKQPNKPVKPVPPTANYTEMRFTGEITHEADKANIGPFFTPGSFDPGSNLGSLGYFNYPAYNETLGLFALLETPNITLYSKENEYEKVSTYEEVTVGGITNLCEDINSKRGWSEFAFKINNPLRYKLNDALDFDKDKTDIKVAFHLTYKSDRITDSYEESNYNLFDKEIKDSNFRIIQYLTTESTPGSYDRVPCSETSAVTKDFHEETIILSSPYYDIEYVNQVLFSGKLEVLSTKSANIPYFTQIDPSTTIRFFPDDQNFRNIDLVKVEMKIMADMYFDQIGTDGEQINTTQAFTYLLYDQENGVSHANPTTNSPSFKTYNPITLELEDEFIDVNSNLVTSIDDNKLYIEAENIIIKGFLKVAQNYTLILKAGGGGGVYMFDNSRIYSGGSYGNVEIADRNLMTTHINSEVTNEWLSDFCTVDGYAANEPVNGPNNENQEPDLNAEKLSEEVNELTIFPNPATDKIFIRFDSDVNQVYKFEITDINGKSVVIETLSGMDSDLYQINTSNFSQGTYIMKIFEGDTPKYVERIMIY